MCYSKFMGDGVAVSAPAQEEEATLESKIKTIHLDRSYISYLVPGGRIAEAGIAELSDKLKYPVKPLPGGAVKNALLANNKVILLLNSNNPNMKKILQHQVGFYEDHSKDIPENEYFRKIVAPISEKIIDSDGQVVGMTQKFLPYGLSDIKKASRNFTRVQWTSLEQNIKEFVESYKNVIAKTHRPQGDFVMSHDTSGYTASWDNIRVDENGKLYFLDYNGQGGRVRYNGEDYYPGEPYYETIMAEDPQRVEKALRQYFGLSTSEEKIAA